MNQKNWLRKKFLFVAFMIFAIVNVFPCNDYGYDKPTEPPYGCHYYCSTHKRCYGSDPGKSCIYCKICLICGKTNCTTKHCGYCKEPSCNGSHCSICVNRNASYSTSRNCDKKHCVLCEARSEKPVCESCLADEKKQKEYDLKKLSEIQIQMTDYSIECFYNPITGELSGKDAEKGGLAKCMNYLEDELLFDERQYYNTNGEYDDIIASRNAIKNNAEEMLKKCNEIQKTMGDPVTIFGGDNTLYLTDLNYFINGIDFSIKRNLSGVSTVVGSLGKGFKTNLDMRIIFGIDKSLESNYLTLKNELLSEAIEDYNLFIKETFEDYGLADDIENSSKTLNSMIANYNTLIKNTDEKYKEITEMYEDRKEKNLHPKAKNVYPKENLDSIKKIVDDFYDLKVELNRRLSILKNKEKTLPNDIKNAKNLQEEIAKLQNIIDFYGENAELSKNTALFKNIYNIFEGSPNYYYDIGVQSICFVDENGLTNIYITKDYKTWVDENGSTITALEDGNYLLTKDFTNYYFNQFGLLTKIEDKYQNAINIYRDDSQKITFIGDKEDNRLVITYQGNFVDKIYLGSILMVDYDYKDNLLCKVSFHDGYFEKYGYIKDDATGSIYLESVEDSKNGKTTFIYEKSTLEDKMRVVKRIDEEGFEETFEYDIQNNKTIYTDQSGVSTIYCGNEQGLIVSKTSGIEQSVFEYDKNGNEILFIENGFSTKKFYDEKNRLIKVLYDNNCSQVYEYDEFGTVVYYKDKENVVFTYDVDSFGNQIRCFVGGTLLWEKSYNQKGLVTQETSFGNQATTIYYQYDEQNRLCKKEFLAQLSSFVDSYNQIYSHITEYNYDSQNRLTETFVNGKLFSKKTYSFLQETEEIIGKQKTITTFDTCKNPLCIEKIDLTTGEKRTIKNEYNVLNLLVKNQNGNVTTEFRYTPNQSLEAQMSIVDNKVFIDFYVYNDSLQVYKSPIEKNILQVEFSQIKDFTEIPFKDWDLFAIKDIAQSNNTLYTEKYEDEYINGVLKSTTTKPLNYQTVQFFDKKADKITINAPGFESKTIQLSPNGTILSKIDVFSVEENDYEFTYYPDGSVKTKTDSKGNTTEYQYYSSGLVKSIISSTSCTWFNYNEDQNPTSVIVGKENSFNTAERFDRFEYLDNGLTVKQFEGDKYYTTYRFNGFGELIAEIDGNGNEKTYSYDENGNKIEESDAYGNTTRFFYNGLNQLTKIVYPDDSFITYEYDLLGNYTEMYNYYGLEYRTKYNLLGQIILEEDSKGIVTEYVYNEDFLLSKVYKNGILFEEYNYNLPKKTVSVRSKMSSSKPSAEYLISTLRQKIYNKQAIPLPETVVKDLSGRIKALYSNGKITNSYTYDNAGMLIEQKDYLTNTYSKFEYDAAKNLVKKETNGEIILYERGKKGEIVKEIDIQNGIETQNYYDCMGNLVKQVFSDGDFVVFEYDKIGRLISYNSFDKQNDLNTVCGYYYDLKNQLSMEAKYTCKSFDDGSENLKITLYEYDNFGRAINVFSTYSEEEIENQIAVFEEYDFEVSKDYVLDILQSSLQSVWLTSDFYNFIAEKLLSKSVFSSYFGKNYYQFLQTEYEYTDFDKIKSATHCFGKIDYEYDANNNLSKVKVNGSDWYKYAYNNAGKVTEESSPFSNTKYFYDSNSVLVKKIVEKNDFVTNIEYNYDALNREVSRVVDGLSVKSVYLGDSGSVLKKDIEFFSNLNEQETDIIMKYWFIDSESKTKMDFEQAYLKIKNPKKKLEILCKESGLMDNCNKKEINEFIENLFHKSEENNCITDNLLPIIEDIALSFKMVINENNKKRLELAAKLTEEDKRRNEAVVKLSEEDQKRQDELRKITIGFGDNLSGIGNLDFPMQKEVLRIQNTAYDYGHFDCDIYAQHIIDNVYGEGTFQKVMLDPVKNNAAEHYINAKDKGNIIEKPNPGTINIGFHQSANVDDYNHVLIVDCKEDGTVTFTHISGNPDVKIYAKGNIEVQTFKNWDAFLASGWNNVSLVQVADRSSTKCNKNN